MIFLSPVDYNQLQGNLFDCISSRNEYVAKAPIDNNPPDYMVTTYPRCEDIKVFGFVYYLFNQKSIAFAHNQDVIISSANNFFRNSLPLGELETLILNNTFRRVMKSAPTLPGRL
jgi:hypothetical protein